MKVIFLASTFTPILPSFGMLFWTSLIFLVFWFMMYKFAFGPIKDALKTRETDIQSALDEAKKAKEEMSNMKAENDALLAKAREERSAILKEAKEAKDQIINEAKVKAKEDAKRIMDEAVREIGNQKQAAVTEVKNQAGLMAIEIAEKLVKKELKGSSEHESFVNSLVSEINLS